MLVYRLLLFACRIPPWPFKFASCVSFAWPFLAKGVADEDVAELMYGPLSFNLLFRRKVVEEIRSHLRDSVFGGPG